MTKEEMLTAAIPDYSQDELARLLESENRREERRFNILLKDFQNRFDLTNDGIAGTNTKPKLIDVIRDIAPFNGRRPTLSISCFRAFVIVFLIICALFYQHAYAESDVINTVSIDKSDSPVYLSDEFLQYSFELIDQRWETLCPDIDHKWLPNLVMGSQEMDTRMDRHYKKFNTEEPFDLTRVYMAVYYEFYHPYSPINTDIYFLIELTLDQKIHMWCKYHSTVPENLKVIGSTDYFGALDSVRQHYNQVIKSESVERDSFVALFGEETLQFDRLLIEPVLTSQFDEKYEWYIRLFQTYNGMYPYLFSNQFINQWATYRVDASTNQLVEADVEDLFSMRIFPYYEGWE